MRARLSRKGSRRLFTATALRSNRRNSRILMRGGIRL